MKILGFNLRFDWIPGCKEVIFACYLLNAIMEIILANKVLKYKQKPLYIQTH